MNNFSQLGFATVIQAPQQFDIYSRLLVERIIFQILPLAVPVPQGSIHKLKMAAGTVIPVHYHPCDEYVYVLHGIIETAGRQCTAGTFWSTPANTKNGPHQAITDVEIITIRLGAIGVFER